MPTDISQFDSRPHHAEVLVLGTGISGLAVDRALTDNDFRVTILGCVTISAGVHGQILLLVCLSTWAALWIHGIKDNPIKEIAKEFGGDDFYANFIYFLGQP